MRAAVAVAVVAAAAELDGGDGPEFGGALLQRRTIASGSLQGNKRRLQLLQRLLRSVREANSQVGEEEEVGELAVSDQVSADGGDGDGVER